jgi:hypothetical protein
MKLGKLDVHHLTKPTHLGITMKIKIAEPIPAKYEDMSLSEVCAYACRGAPVGVPTNWIKHKACMDYIVMLIKLHHEEITGGRENITFYLNGYGFFSRICFKNEDGDVEEMLAHNVMIKLKNLEKEQPYKERILQWEMQQEALLTIMGTQSK